MRDKWDRALWRRKQLLLIALPGILPTGNAPYASPPPVGRLSRRGNGQPHGPWLRHSNPRNRGPWTATPTPQISHTAHGPRNTGDTRRTQNTALDHQTTEPEQPATTRGPRMLYHLTKADSQRVQAQDLPNGEAKNTTQHHHTTPNHPLLTQTSPERPPATDTATHQAEHPNHMGPHSPGAQEQHPSTPATPPPLRQWYLTPEPPHTTHCPRANRKPKPKPHPGTKPQAEAAPSERPHTATTPNRAHHQEPTRDPTPAARHNPDTRHVVSAIPQGDTPTQNHPR